MECASTGFFCLEVVLGLAPLNLMVYLLNPDVLAEDGLWQLPVHHRLLAEVEVLADGAPPCQGDRRRHPSPASREEGPGLGSGIDL